MVRSYFLYDTWHIHHTRSHLCTWHYWCGEFCATGFIRWWPHQCRQQKSPRGLGFTMSQTWLWASRCGTASKWPQCMECSARPTCSSGSFRRQTTVAFLSVYSSQPWVRLAGGRARSPTAHEVRLQKQRDRRAAAKAAPKAAGLRRSAAARDPGAPAQPRQVRRHHEKKVCYAGCNQRKVTAAERQNREFVCDFPGCNLRFETSRALQGKSQ